MTTTSATEAQLKDALAWEQGIPPESPEADKNVFVWMWEAVQGDFNDKRSTGQVAFDMAVSIIPFVDQVCDVRDLVANCKAILQSKEHEQTRWLWVSLALTLIGFFPALGSLVKGCLKIFFLFIRRHGLEHILKAVNEGMTWVITFLRKREVQHYLRLHKVDDVFGFLADGFRQVRGMVSPRALLTAFDRAIALMKALLQKIAWMPEASKKAEAAIEQVAKVRRMADEHLGAALKPVQDVLDAIVKRMEHEQFLHRAAIKNAANVHFRGTLTEARAVTLMQETKPRPPWLSKGKDLKFPQIDPEDEDTLKLLRKAKEDATVEAKTRARKLGFPESEVPVEHWPELTDNNIRSFNKLSHDIIKGPAKLYRIGSPASGAVGDCWVTEEVFERLMAAPNSKDAWREHLAVWPHWNADGQFFVYELKAGESLKVWRGPASGQLLDENLHFGDHLRGGWEQVIFKPTKENNIQHDSFGVYEVAGDGRLTPVDPSLSNAGTRGNPEGAAKKTIKLREKINDPHISGPFDTGWPTTDFDSQLLDVKIGLPAMPGQVTNKADKL